MMFIQDGDNFNDFSNNISSDNNITANVTLSNTILNKIRNDYDTLIDKFITNKEEKNSVSIKSFIDGVM